MASRLTEAAPRGSGGFGRFAAAMMGRAAPPPPAPPAPPVVAESMEPPQQPLQPPTSASITAPPPQQQYGGALLKLSHIRQQGHVVAAVPLSTPPGVGRRNAYVPPPPHRPPPTPPLLSAATTVDSQIAPLLDDTLVDVPTPQNPAPDAVGVAAALARSGRQSGRRQPRSTEKSAAAKRGRTSSTSSRLAEQELVLDSNGDLLESRWITLTKPGRGGRGRGRAARVLIYGGQRFTGTTAHKMWIKIGQHQAMREAHPERAGAPQPMGPSQRNAPKAPSLRRLVVSAGPPATLAPAERRTNGALQPALGLLTIAPRKPQGDAPPPPKQRTRREEAPQQSNILLSSSSSMSSSLSSATSSTSLGEFVASSTPSSDHDDGELWDADVLLFGAGTAGGEVRHERQGNAASVTSTTDGGTPSPAAQESSPPNACAEGGRPPEGHALIDVDMDDSDVGGAEVQVGRPSSTSLLASRMLPPPPPPLPPPQKDETQRPHGPPADLVPPIRPPNLPPAHTNRRPQAAPQPSDSDRLKQLSNELDEIDRMKRRLVRRRIRVVREIEGLRMSQVLCAADAEVERPLERNVPHDTPAYPSEKPVPLQPPLPLLRPPYNRYEDDEDDGYLAGLETADFLGGMNFA